MLLLFCFCFVWCQLSLCGAIFCMLSLLRSTTGLVAMPNRTCWDVYIIHPNNTNVSMLHLLFIFAFFIMLSLFLCIFLFSFLLVFVQALFAVWQPFCFYCFTLQFSVYMVFNALMWCYSLPNPRNLRFAALFTLLFCAISFKFNPNR